MQKSVFGLNVVVSLELIAYVAVLPAVHAQRNPGILLYPQQAPQAASALTNPLLKEMATQIGPDAPPDATARAFWSTLLPHCKRPEEASASIFYSEKKEQTAGARLGMREQRIINWTLTEYQGDFSYLLSPTKTPSEAAKRNNGAQWSAESYFRAPTYRTMTLKLVQWVDNGTILQSASYKTAWSKWHDTPNCETCGPWSNASLTLYMDKDLAGLHIQWGAYGKLHKPETWEPMSCSVATSADPFSAFPVQRDPH